MITLRVYTGILHTHIHSHAHRVLFINKDTPNSTYMHIHPHAYIHTHAHTVLPINKYTPNNFVSKKLIFF